MLFDTHAHLYDEKFQYDREEMIADVLKTVEHVVIPAEDRKTGAQALALSLIHI